MILKEVLPTEQITFIITKERLSSPCIPLNITFLGILTVKLPCTLNRQALSQ